ncbi:MAG: hypothetical protein K9G58_11450 [Bacteroidales bacterium]|nr:hypothetical protein [Bacteroidales bacterium]MCF8388119.1 hypothetical protein [Bacteroidales bacterium]MCF8398778.1 hypothetical protein [Bacteroidales bacterium]
MRTEKKMIISFISMLISGMLIFSGNIYTQEVSKSDVFEKNYDVDANTEIGFYNKLGDVKINTWDKQQMRLRVEYTIEVKKPEDLETFVKAIRNPMVEINEEHLIIDTKFFESLSTKNSSFSRSTSMKFENGKSIDIESYKVNYTVYIPRNNEFFLNSSYSDIQIDALFARSKLTVYDGNLELVRCAAPISFDLRYTDLIASEMEECVLKLYDSDVEIGNAGTLELDSKYSKVHVKECMGVKLNSYDDKIYFDKVSGIEGTAKYTTLVTTNLNEVVLDAYDCSFDFGNLNMLNLKSSYSRMAFGNIEEHVDLQSYDDKISFRGIASLEGNSKYTTFTIGIIEEKFKLNSYDDNINVNHLKPGFDLVELETKYTNLEIDVDDKADYKISIDSRYTNIDLDKRKFDEIILEKESEKLLADYIKKGGSPKKNSVIRIKSYDGKVEIN